jgi:hypothetical protein
MMTEADARTELTPKKRSLNVAELEEEDQTRKRQRSPEDLPPTPQSEPARPLPTALEPTSESEGSPPLSEIPAPELETPPFLRQMADAAAQTESFQTPTFPNQVHNTFTAPPYYHEIPEPQEPYVGVGQYIEVNGNDTPASAVDMTAGPLYDPETTPHTRFPVAPTMLPAGGASTEIGYMGAGALDGPFQYQESAERFYRPSEAQFEFARNLQQTIAVESPNEPLNLLAGVANNLNQQPVHFPDTVPQQTIQAPPEDDFDLTEIVPNLFVGS